MKILIVSGDRTEPGGWPRNLGDALLTDALLAYVRGLGHDAAAVDFGNPPPVADRVRVSGVPDLAARIRRADLVLLGGGTLLQDDQRATRVGGLPRMCSVVVTLARIRRTRVGFVCVGVEATDRPLPRRMLSLAARGSEFVIARDADSVAHARRYGKAAVLGCDAALLPDHPPSDRETGAGDAVLALNRRDVERLTPARSRILADRFGPLRLLSMDQSPAWDFDGHADGTHGVTVLEPKRDVGSMLTEIAAARVVIASRMHALYAAAMLGVPSIAVGRSSKVRSFAAEFGVPVQSLPDIDESQAIVADPATIERARARGRAALEAVL